MNKEEVKAWADTEFGHISRACNKVWGEMLMRELTGPDFYTTFGLMIPEPPPWENDYII